MHSIQYCSARIEPLWEPYGRTRIWAPKEDMKFMFMWILYGALKSHGKKGSKQITLWCTISISKHTFNASSSKHFSTFSRVFALLSRNRHPDSSAKARPSSLVTILSSSCKMMPSKSKLRTVVILPYRAHWFYFLELWMLGGKKE